ncbi:MAG TPA: CPBP family intramembrane metalloprotease [Casimicrobiaceae bacterium]|nr:CPBP family intramembrane metalloprotease [Casimicrobiaceae bacterium]
MTGLTRRPVFWVGYALLALLCAAVARHLFPLAIPLVNLDIKLARHEAIAKAETIARERGLVPDGARAAAQFRNDQSAQNYIELEGGGKPAFTQLVEGTIFAPFWWEVRLFKPGEVTEATVRFRPDGGVDGFSRRLPESFVRDPATKALDRDSALSLAQTRARMDWNVDFTPYQLREHSQKTRPSGRVDHEFVFERDEHLGDARIRLQLDVTGDELTRVAPYIYVPEKFERRFQELRSANNTIANFASLAAGVLYGLGGCVLGVLWLLRTRWLLWRPALAAGAVVGGLMALSSFAAAPAGWFAFDTAQTTGSFWVAQIGVAIATLIGGTLGYGLAFMAAESLSRRAFPHQPQLWRLWSREGGASVQTLGRSVGGYLFVPLELAFISAFYYVTNHWLGWWQPSESLTDPNILSSAVPALAPIAISLQAGFMEECVFRAIPLAGAALLGAHFGQRAHWIGFAVVLQAVVFAGAHANYPGFPSYSRLVELLVPAILWALIFLRFGLLPTILLHALFDLALFSIPLFLVDAPGAWIQRVLVIAAAAFPLAVIGVRRWRRGAWRRLPAQLWNGGWRPPPATVLASAIRIGPAPASAPVAWVWRALPWLGVAGALAWLACTPFAADVPALTIGRAAAEAAAVSAVERRGVLLGPEWRRHSSIRSSVGELRQTQAHTFVWREAGPDTYRALAGNVLAPPLWEVRFARFEGDVADRAEEWRVYVVGNGEIRQVRHRLPEGAAGANLAHDEALAIAHRAVRERFGHDPAALQLRTADQTRRDARSDWTFVFADPAIDVGKDGEARIQVVVAGDEVVAAGRTVFVPETWLRAETERDERLQVLKLTGILAVALGALAALVFAVISWNQGHCDKRAMALVGALAMAAAIIDLGNDWPDMLMGLQTTEPVALQLAASVSGKLFAAILVAGLMALLSGVGSWFARSRNQAGLASRMPAWAAGAAVALAVAGLAAASSTMAERTMPLWPALGAASLAWPLLGAVVDPIGLVWSSGAALFVLYLIELGTHGWTRRVWVAALLLVAISCAGGLAAGGEPAIALVSGVVKGLVSFVLLWRVLRHDLRTIPAFLATGMVLDGARNAALSANAAAWPQFAIGVIVTVAVAWAVTRYLARPLRYAPVA